MNKRAVVFIIQILILGVVTISYALGNEVGI